MITKGLVRNLFCACIGFAILADAAAAMGAPSEPALSEVEGTKSQVGESCFHENE